MTSKKTQKVDVNPTEEIVIEEDTPIEESTEEVEPKLNEIKGVLNNTKLNQAERQQQIYSAMNKMVIVRN